MSELNKELAIINSFELNINDRGILVFNIQVEYESGWNQCVGGLVLDTYVNGKNGAPGKRVGTSYGCEMIRQLMLVLEVDNFNDAKGKIVYILGEGDGLSFNPKGIETLRINGKVKSLVFDDLNYLLEKGE